MSSVYPVLPAPLSSSSISLSSPSLVPAAHTIASSLEECEVVVEQGPVAVRMVDLLWFCITQLVILFKSSVNVCQNAICSACKCAFAFILRLAFCMELLLTPMMNCGSSLFAACKTATQVIANVIGCCINVLARPAVHRCLRETRYQSHNTMSTRVKSRTMSWRSRLSLKLPRSSLTACCSSRRALAQHGCSGKRQCFQWLLLRFGLFMFLLMLDVCFFRMLLP